MALGWTAWELLAGILLTAVVGYLVSRYFTSQTQKDAKKNILNSDKPEKKKGTLSIIVITTKLF